MGTGTNALCLGSNWADERKGIDIPDSYGGQRSEF